METTILHLQEKWQIRGLGKSTQGPARRSPIYIYESWMKWKHFPFCKRKYSHKWYFRYLQWKWHWWNFKACSCLLSNPQWEAFPAKASLISFHWNCLLWAAPAFFHHKRIFLIFLATKQATLPLAPSLLYVGLFQRIYQNVELNSTTFD